MVQVQNVISGRIFLPLAIGYLWSYAKSDKKIDDNYELKNVFFRREPTEKIIDQMDNPSIIGLSTYVWNWEISKSVAKAAKAKWPDCKIVMGGPHVPYQADFQEELPYVDFVVTFGGEEQFQELLLENLSEDPDFDNIDGLITRNTKTMSKRKREENVNDFPSPYLDGFYDKLIEQHPDIHFNMVIESNRGCPYTCSFCDMQDKYYNKLNFFDLDTVKAEIEWGAKNQIEYIDCADSNFGIHKRDIGIAQIVADTKRKYGYPRMFNFTSAKNQPKHVEEIQTILGKVGIDRGISVSLQSFNQDTLDSIKRWNARNDMLEEKFSKYKTNNLESFVEIILGLPNESKESWIAGINDLLIRGYDQALLIHPLSVVPNTPFSDPSYIDEFDLKYTTTRSPAQGFCFGDESPEERETICYSSKTMPEEDWIDSYIYGKCIVGAQYFHGLSYFLALLMQREYKIAPGIFYEKQLEYSKSSKGFLNGEYISFRDNIRSSLFDLRPWGRKIFGDNDMYWSDQAAAAISIINNYQDYANDLLKFIKEEFKDIKIDLVKEVIDYNYFMLEKPSSESQVSKTFNYNWKNYFDNLDSLKAKSETYSIEYRPWKDHHDHAIHTYWYGRKSRRCFAQINKEKEIAS